MDPGEWIEFGADWQYRYCPSASLFRNGERVPIGTLQAELLELLVARPGHVVLREELVERLWRTPHISKNSLHELVSTLRKILGDSSKAPGFIKTEKNRGYRWIAPVRKVVPPSADARETSTDVPSEPTARAIVPHLPQLSIRPRRFTGWMVALLALHQLLAEWAEAVFIFGHLGVFLLLAPLNSVCVLAASATGLWRDWVRTSQQRSNGFAVGIATALGGLALVVTFGLWFLPPRAEITLASLGWAPRAGFIKSALIYQAILSITFVHLPFHIVAALNAELLLGRSRNVYALICGRRTGVSPTGTIFLRPVVLAWIFVALAAAGVPMTLVLLNGLTETPESSLFSQLALLRFVTWWGTALAALAWYAAKLNQMKVRALSE